MSTVAVDDVRALAGLTTKDLEAVVDRGITTFIEVGEALLLLRDRREYIEEYGTWENYTRVMWGFGRSRAHRLIEAAQVAAALPVGNIQNERQARVLAPVLRDHGPDVVAEVVAEAGGPKAPAQRLAEVVRGRFVPEAEVDAEAVPAATGPRLNAAGRPETERQREDREKREAKKAQREAEATEHRLWHMNHVLGDVMSYTRELPDPQEYAADLADADCEDEDPDFDALVAWVRDVKRHYVPARRALLAKWAAEDAEEDES